MSTINNRARLLFEHTFIVAALTLVFMPFATYPTGPDTAESQNPVQIGAYLARAGDCAACHTAKTGQPFAGGSMFSILVGKVYSTNITPDSETGIGRYSLNDFVKVMREGIAKDGHHLFPAMPYPSYSKVSQEDLAALYAFFMQVVKPAHRINNRAKLKWPLGSRSLMTLWNALYLKKGEYPEQPNKTASWNRGAYLVKGLGHCGDCHTARGIAGQVLSNSEKDRKHFLSGATIENWYAPPLTGNAVTGLLAWTKEDLAELLKTGRTARVGAAGMMADVVEKSTQYLTDSDLMSIAEYLKALPSSVDEKQSAKVLTGSDKRIDQAINSETQGQCVYLNNCNACHGSGGAGVNRIFPNLIHNEAINAPTPISLIHIVLTGSSIPLTQTAPSAFAMPGFGWRLTDAQIADVLTFARSSWGNCAKPVGSAEVRRLRITLTGLEK